jgi:signal transduction histidine kinase
MLAAGLAITGVVGRGLHREARQRDAQRFDLETLQIAASLESNMERHEERLARLADHCAQFEELPTQVWYFRREEMTDLNGNLPSVLHAVYCPKIVATNFVSHLERGRKVWPARYQFDPEPRPRRELALPVWQKWDRAGFAAIPLGTDLAEETNGYPSLIPALGAGRGWVSARPAQAPRRDGRAANGFWFALPLFALEQPQIGPAETGRETPQDRTKRHRAFKSSSARGVLAVFLSTDDMVDRAFNSTNRPVRIHARLYAKYEPAKEAILNPLSASPENPRHRRLLVMPWYGRRWCLELMSTPLFEAESLRSRSSMVAGGGAGFSLLAAALLGVSLRARSRQERMTAEIMDARDALAATEKAREKLGHDLHDGAIQSLYAVQLGLSRTAEAVAATLPAAAHILNDTRQRVDEVIAELRRFILSREESDETREAPNLEQVLASIVQRLRTTTPANLRFEAAPACASQIPVAHAVTLTQVARTALANCLRHAQAVKIAVTLRRTADTIQLVIEDDGIGFDTNRPETGGTGLRIMRKRVTEAGGKLVIESTPGRGTRICASLPCQAPGPSANNPAIS